MDDGTDPEISAESGGIQRLEVAEVVAEAGDARTLVFEAEHLAYRPGQFLTLRIPSDRCGSVARCYSLSSSPHTDRLPAVTVKRVDDGYASGWLCDNARPGLELDVLRPAGIFTPASLDDDIVAFAAGSGITPVMAIVKSMLAAGAGRVLLCYANRDEHSVIFASQLRRLAEAHPDRLTAVHWLESVQGLPTSAALTELARPYAGRPAFVCGPAAFMREVRAALRALGVPRERIHLERFQSLTGNPFEEGPTARTRPDGRAASRVQVQLDGERHAFRWPADRRLLDLLLDNGLAAPYSCREGACSACACRITEGEVRMVHNDVLEEEDLVEGYVLACQALPVTDSVSVSYDD